MSDNRMNVAVSVNSAYITPLKVMLFSLAQNTNKNLHIYLLYCALSVSEREGIKTFVEGKCCGVLHEIFVDEKLFSEYPYARSLWSVEIFFRLLLPYILAPTVEKILWLDADIIVCGNIDGLYDMEMGGHYLCAAPDYSRKALAKRLNLDPDQTYFNSGVLIMNLPMIRACISQNQLFEFMVRNRERLRFPDQDTINLLMGHNVLLFDELIYNNQGHLHRKVTKDACVIHYIMPTKPWKIYYYGNKYAASCFWKYAVQCGFKRSVFSLAGNGICRLLYAFYVKIKLGHLYAIYHKLRYRQPYQNQTER